MIQQRCCAHQLVEWLSSVLLCTLCLAPTPADGQRACMRCADALRRIAGEHAGVSIGSYPNVAECGALQTFRVRLQLESRDEEALQRAVAAVKEGIECSDAPGA